MRTKGFKIKKKEFEKLLNRMAPKGTIYTVSDPFVSTTQYVLITVTQWGMKEGEWQQTGQWNAEVNNFLMLQPKPKEMRK